jgi:enamine deaminase RidA (YjgF/YER057c/UK114 family)
VEIPLSLAQTFAQSGFARFVNSPAGRVARIASGNQVSYRGAFMRKLVSSGSPYEPKVGISRAVRAGPIVTVAGTAPLGPDGRTVGRGDPAAQARRCLEIVAAALQQAGASLRDVVRTRILLTRIDDWQMVAAVHGEFFRDIRPANTIMQVSRFIDPEWLIEIEADAVVDEGERA